MEDDLWWKTTFDERRPSREDGLKIEDDLKKEDNLKNEDDIKKRQP